MKFNHTAHKNLWDWLSKNPDKEKDDWSGWEFNGGSFSKVSAGCFACQYQDEMIELGPCEETCPLIWPTSPCEEFYDWDSERNHAERKRLAGIIRDLPVREGVETI